ncbi:MAG: FprA family A-type flavoprotein [Bacteroidales bacterium]|nr:FprA family A-type flavoprotein [Bacteroidales bacterium]MBR5862876.1 FprA family A-type flavoprotein [Bacteroidales bacterium]
MTKISDRIYSVGVNDDDKVLFEGLWPIPYGVSYNSYLVVDEKVALIDTVECGFEDEFLANINEAIGGRNIDYLVVNHMEPDHSSLVAYMLETYPGLQIIANAKTVPMLKGYYGTPEERITVVGEGSSLSLGGCTLNFSLIPMVHWPETMVTWLAEENTLFSGDAFGTFGAVAEEIVDEDGTFEQYKDEMTRYYACIVGKYGTPVQTALKKLSGLEIKRICSTHGPVWEQNIPQVVALYDRMSRYEVERGVCIVYGSMYGNTAAAADALALELEARGIPYAIHDLAGNNAGELGLSGALRDVFKYDTIIVGSPTYNNGIFPPVETFMKALQARLIKGRRFYAFGSYTWSGASVSLLNSLATAMGFELLGDGLSFAQAYTKEKVDMAAVADMI